MFPSILMMDPKIESSYKSMTGSFAFETICSSCDVLPVGDAGAEQGLFAISLYVDRTDVSVHSKLSGDRKKVNSRKWIRM